MISVIIDNTLDFWVTTDGEIDHILSAMTVFVDELTLRGYQTKNVFVGGGVDESDTGYRSFSGSYDDFKDLKNRLKNNFLAKESQLDGYWITTLNFESIYVDLEKGIKQGRLWYSRGKLALDCPDEARIFRKCKKAIQPYLYKDPYQNKDR